MKNNKEKIKPNKKEKKNGSLKSCCKKLSCKHQEQHLENMKRGGNKRVSSNAKFGPVHFGRKCKLQNVRFLNFFTDLETSLELWYGKYDWLLVLDEN